jgi:hypothetical protein
MKTKLSWDGFLYRSPPDKNGAKIDQPMQKLMEFVCEHCGKLETSSVYQVVSEEGGIVLLDMIVCHSCYLQAKNLGLDAKEIDLSGVCQINDNLKE